MHRGEVVGTWGEHDHPEMCFSATKSFVGLVAGIAHDRGLLDVDAPVRDAVRWVHLLQQTSQWDGVLWGKPTSVDAQSNGASGPPGAVWSYNDVRVNLLCLALTGLFGQALPEVLAEAVMRPLGASPLWQWHGYDNSFSDVDGVRVPVVSGGAHWGGGLWMSALDLALVGQLYLRNGEWEGRRLLSAEWIARSWTPCPVKPDYGYLWWLNDQQTVFPEAPATGRCARGNGGRHLLWVDPARDLVITSHWGEDVGQLVAEVSAAVSVSHQ
ncbi:serine hydrolase domain-containing protein [Actinophytocola sp.]|uniref:serine hydrolase domain-containing protein n=1 Tax=Actinophytocola sp. TaxID=1872138 RepID=UPI002ED39BC8